VQGAEGALGWVGFAFADGAGDDVKVLAVSDGEGECVSPSAETIADGSYTLSRSLYVYVNKAAAEDNPAVAAYVDHYLSDRGREAVETAGYVGLPDDQWDDSVQTWADRVVGSTEAG
jgi:phosphate transport system substrate-binding protein